ncbi:MAG: methylenetetrahydrofolate reductase [NAD(P)H] [Muribaculaceae bacterium]|nr:methylenetetrahydrofolate reductase [NAD(P)H] [Muribaculaceae bacterium]
MDIAKILSQRTSTGFSFETLPPLKGKGISQLFSSIEQLKEFDPLYINITTHRSEMVYRSTPDGLYEKISERSRPGTVAVAAAIQNRYGIPAVPHLICSGFTRTETEYALIDLNFLGINNVLILRGDKAKHESRFIPNENGHSHAIELAEQVNQFNRGFFLDGTQMDIITDTPFSYGVAGYPEKHDEAPNLDIDLMFLKQKVDAGAGYVVTQMFFDNSKYFEFVENCRRIGINVPIIPGIKPLLTKNQLSILPKVFHVDIPTELAMEVIKCQSDNEVKELGVKWAVEQCKELIKAQVPSIHFYSLNATQSVKKIAKQVY